MFGRDRYAFGVRHLQGEFRGWGFEDFTAGDITTTSVTLSANENGTDLYGFESGRIVNNTAVIVRKDYPTKKAYTGTTRLFSTKVEMSAHTGNTSITLTGVPHSSWGDIRIYYFYDYPLGMPQGYQIPSRAVAGNLFAELQDLFLTEEELIGGDKSAIFANLDVDTVNIDSNVISDSTFRLYLKANDSGIYRGVVVINDGDTGDLALAPTHVGTSLGMGGDPFYNLHLANTAIIDTMDIGAGRIIDTSGAISFGDETISIAGDLTDGTNTLTVANAKTAYDHSQVAGGDSVHVSTTENTNWDTAYTHSQDNSQAHSDYLINNGDDSTSGALTVGSLVTGSDIGIAADTDLIQLTAADTMQINGSLGIGVSPSYPLEISHTRIGIGNYYAGKSFLELNPSENSTGWPTSFFADLQVKSGNTRDFVGLIGFGTRVFHYGTGTIDEMRGNNLVARNKSTGTITLAKGANFEIDNDNAGGEITTAYGAYINYGLNNGTIGTACGVYINDILGTTKWSIYDNAQESSCLGALRVGSTATPTEALHFADAKNIAFDTTTGTKIGTATNQKLAFYNSTPIIKQAGVAVTAAGIHAALVNLGLIAA